MAGLNGNRGDLALQLVAKALSVFRRGASLLHVLQLMARLSVLMHCCFVLSCALGQVWWTDNHSCSNCDLFAYMSWMQGKLSCSCQSINLLTETFGSSLIQNGLNFFFVICQCG